MVASRQRSSNGFVGAPWHASAPSVAVVGDLLALAAWVASSRLTQLGHPREPSGPRTCSPASQLGPHRSGASQAGGLADLSTAGLGRPPLLTAGPSAGHPGNPWDTRSGTGMCDVVDLQLRREPTSHANRLTALALHAARPDHWAPCPWLARLHEVAGDRRQVLHWARRLAAHRGATAIAD